MHARDALSGCCTLPVRSFTPTISVRGTFVSQLLKTKIDITALDLMDLIGFRAKDDMVFQINAGESGESLCYAERALAKARHVSLFSPVLRTRFDERSYLYNTDGLMFSVAGYLVV